MKEIRYGDSAYLMRFEYPDQWAAGSITAVLISVFNTSGSALIDEQDATLYSGATIDGDVSAGTNTITLSAGDPVLSPGDRIYIADSDDGPPEIATVYSYDSTTLTITTEQDLSSSHSDGASVSGMWATYSADFSGSDFVAGNEYLAKWDPDIDAIPAQEMYRIAAQTAIVGEFWDRLAASYPTAWEIAKNRNLGMLEDEINKALSVDFTARGRDYNRITDSDLVGHGMILKANAWILGSGGDETETEYQRATAEYKSWFLSVADSSTLWFDNDQDMAQDEGEIGAIDYSPVDRYL